VAQKGSSPRATAIGKRTASAWIFKGPVTPCPGPKWATRHMTLGVAIWIPAFAEILEMIVLAMLATRKYERFFA